MRTSPTLTYPTYPIRSLTDVRPSSAVLLSDRVARYVPLEKMRFLAAARFASFGILVLMGSDLGVGGLMDLGARAN
jgi:hypothetical protein